MLEDAIGGIRDEAVALSEQGIWIALTGLILLLTDKVMKSLKANWALVARFSDWLFKSWPALGSAGIACGFQRNIHDLDHHCRRLTL